MANVNAPFGLRPIRYVDGRAYNGEVTEYFATGATGVIRPGDPVVDSGSSNTAEVQGRAPGTLPSCTVSLDGDGDPIIGVCVGVVPVHRDSLPYRETSTDRIILVARGPDLVFEVQANAGGTALAATDVGLHANLKVATTATYISDWTLDTTAGGGVAPANDPSNQLKILGFSKNPKREIGAYAVVEVLINNHVLANVDDAGRSTAS